MIKIKDLAVLPRQKGAPGLYWFIVYHNIMRKSQVCMSSNTEHICDTQNECRPCKINITGVINLRLYWKFRGCSKEQLRRLLLHMANGVIHYPTNFGKDINLAHNRGLPHTQCGPPWLWCPQWWVRSVKWLSSVGDLMYSLKPFIIQSYCMDMIYRYSSRFQEYW